MLLFLSCNNSGREHKLDVVNSVNLEKYAGTWYEIARLPNSFERGLKCVTATYTIQDNGKIEVLNKGHLINNPDKVEKAKGTAWIPDPDTPGKLKVRFFWPFAGDYWILDLDEQYQYALVGSPDLKYLWILSRQKRISESLYNQLLAKAEKMGFKTKNIVKVPQDCQGV